MKFFREIRVLIEDSLQTGKEIIFFIVLANLALVFGYMLKGYEDMAGLILRMSFLTMFIPVLFTIRKHFLN
ncbi:MAG TPA: hypothetical protein VD908_17930 [Cytophagales bacterium]|nr:hypothetical protein [Cytophagales bacterium]